ncbi:MAG: winged helix-turn-helix domain-containing protein [Candidatus Nitrosomaritimum yanchengensis]
MAKRILDVPYHPKIAEIIQNKKIEPTFRPSIKTLAKILCCVGEQGPSAKTELSRKTNLNYTRLAKHVVWMEKKGYVESVIRESKINIKLTAEGRLFAKSISNEE